MAVGHDRSGLAVSPVHPRRLRTWADIPSVSGAQCARALARAGFEVSLDGPDRVVVRRCGVPLLNVPMVDRVRPAIMVAIARTAGLTAEQFMELLE